MAKAAGETLCAEMNEAWRPLHVTVDRLPRLRSDQTASVIASEPAFPCRSPAAVRAGDAVLAAQARSAEQGGRRPSDSFGGIATMLFNSHEFLFVFLPATLLGFFLTRARFPARGRFFGSF